MDLVGQGVALLDGFQGEERVGPDGAVIHRDLERRHEGAAGQVEQARSLEGAVIQGQVTVLRLRGRPSTQVARNFTPQPRGFAGWG